MAAVDSSQAQVEVSALLPGSQPNSPQPTENLTEDVAEKSRSVVPYLLENSPEFRELSDVRQQVSHIKPRYHTYIILTMLPTGMGSPGRRQILRKPSSKCGQVRRKDGGLLP